MKHLIPPPENNIRPIGRDPSNGILVLYGIFVAKFRQCRFFSDKRCKVWYDTYKRGSVFTDPGRNSILYPVFEKRDPCGNAKAVSFAAGPDQRRRFLHAETLICDSSCADSSSWDFWRHCVWRSKICASRYDHDGRRDAR